MARSPLTPCGSGFGAPGGDPFLALHREMNHPEHRSQQERRTRAGQLGAGQHTGRSQQLKRGYIWGSHSPAGTTRGSRETIPAPRWELAEHRVL